MGNKLNFTKANLAALPIPPEGKRAYYQDSKTRGLAFAITDRGTRSYVFYRKIDGRPERILLGRFEDLAIEQARNKAAELNAMIASGQNPADHRRVARAEMTLGELFDEYLERYAKLHVKYHRQYAAQFRLNFREPASGRIALASRQLSKITRADLAEVHGRITRAGKPLTANRVLAMISSVFGWAVRSGLIETNPATGIRKNSERAHQRDRFLQAEEMPYFFQAVAAHPSEVMRDYVLLSLLTGQRQANVLAMEWSEIDLANQLWRIPRSKTKTVREYVVPLVPEAARILSRRRQEAGMTGRYVLPGIGREGHFAEPKNGWKRIKLRAELYRLLDAMAKADGWTLERLHLEKEKSELSLTERLVTNRNLARNLGISPESFEFNDLRMHDLRRTLASWQAITGANLVAISKTLNHSNVATTSIYARLHTDPVRQAIQTAAGAMFEAAGICKSGEVAGAIGKHRAA